MTATFTWNITGMECYPEAEGKTDVVFKVYYTCTATEDDEKFPMLYISSSQIPVTYTAGSPYTPYNQLTNEQVIGWVKDALREQGVTDMEANTLARLEASRNPPVINPPLPWITES